MYSSVTRPPVYYNRCCNMPGLIMISISLVYVLMQNQLYIGCVNLRNVVTASLPRLQCSAPFPHHCYLTSPHQRTGGPVHSQQCTAVYSYVHRWRPQHSQQCYITHYTHTRSNQPPPMLGFGAGFGAGLKCLGGLLPLRFISNIGRLEKKICMTESIAIPNTPLFVRITHNMKTFPFF